MANALMGARGAVDLIVDHAKTGLNTAGEMVLLAWDSSISAATDIVRGRFSWDEFFEQSWFMTRVSLLPTILVSIPFGVIVSVQVGGVAGQIGAQSFIGAVNAIGVMFHIVNDDLWRQAIARLLASLMPDGLMLVGGDFGDETRNVQLHRTDRFESWREHDAAPSPAALVNKRVRSLHEWNRVAGELGATVVEVIRSDATPDIRTPENDLLVLRHEQGA